MSIAASCLHSDHRRLFLALTIVKSKPQQISIRGFLQEIRKSIKEGSSSTILESAQYIDGIAHWRYRYEKQELEVQALKNHVAQLEQEYKALGAHTDIEQTTPHKANSQRKRKRSPSPIYSLGTMKRKHLIQPDDDIHAQATIDSLELHLPNPRLSYHIKRIYTLRRISTQTSPTSKDLAASLIELCSETSSLVAQLEGPASSLKHSPPKVKITRHSANTNNQRQPSPQADDAVRIQLLKATFRQLIESLSAYNTRDGSEAIDGQIVYTLSTLIGEVISHISRLSFVSNTGPKRPNKRNARSKAPCTLYTTVIDAKDIRFELARLIAWFLGSLDLSLQVHREILDGSLYYILKRVGELLQVFVFDEEEDRLAESTPTPTGVDRLNIAALQSEAPYIGWTLERALAASRQSSSGRDNTQPPSTSSTANRGPASSNDLPSETKVKLQSTMLQVIFDQDEEIFKNRLLPPSDPGFDSSQPPRFESNNAAEWFKRKIWNTVGWDILIKHVAWAEDS